MMLQCTRNVLEIKPMNSKHFCCKKLQSGEMTYCDTRYQVKKYTESFRTPSKKLIEKSGSQTNRRTSLREQI